MMPSTDDLDPRFIIEKNHSMALPNIKTELTRQYKLLGLYL